MATLILLAGTSAPISVTCQRAGKASPRFVGSKSLSFSGRERTSIRGQAKVIPIIASYVSTADEAAIQAAVMNGVQIPCSGDILGNLQTLCSISDVTSNMIPGLVDFWEMSFTVNEVNASTILLRYAPGDTITGESFTRSTGELYYDVNGVVIQSLGVNAKADNHYLNGVRSLLLEDTRTNSLLRSNEFNNAAWTKSTMTVTTGIADPAGGTTACTLTATGPIAFAQQTLGASSSLVRTNSVWLRRRTGTGSIQIRSPDGVTVGVTLTGSYQRFSAPGAASTLRDSIIFVNVSGDAVDAWGYQMEDGSSVSSYFPTTTAATVRGVCSYSLPFTSPPAEITIYAKFVELGTTRVTGGRIFEISSAADVSPRLLVQALPTVYSVFHGESAGNVSSSLAAGPALNDVVELTARLFGDGSVDLTQSINGATSTSSTQSASNPLASAWSGLLVWLNSGGTAGGTTGFTALQSFKIVSGSRSMAEMRVA